MSNSISEIIFASQNVSGLQSVSRWIIQIGSSLALGIVFFTLFLKLITLPFDAISRIQMRKNSLIMEKMRPELEKLQKQYANDKMLYNQKMMALYKKNGYSMFGACLPTIITLVVFIIAITAFNGYSKYQNRVYFLEMSKSYNQAIYEGIEVDNDYIKFNTANGILKFDDQKIIDATNGINIDSNHTVENEGNEYTLNNISNPEYSYIITKEEGTPSKYKIKSKPFAGDKGYYAEYVQEYEINDGKVEVKRTTGKFEIDKDKIPNTITVGGKTVDDYIAELPEKTEYDFISAYGSQKSAESFRSQIKGSKFLWVSNIWEKDSPSAHPVKNSWGEFKSEYGYDENPKVCNMNSNPDNYKLLIADLGEEKAAQNGYFILAVLTAVTAFLMQFVMTKTQKASMELQTVNGQGARTQKMMMWIMPIMMAIFAFMYTAAFSIYMILSQILSIGFTLLINWLIGKKFKNKEMAKEPQKIRGRVYVPETKPEETKKSKDATPEHDFIKNGKTSHVRGRLK